MFDIENIENPLFIKKLKKKEKIQLAKEIREFLINNISKTGGHLSSNLGIVELMIALYSAFDYDKIRLLFDVGHQTYVQKILTGRASKFNTLRKKDGLSGFVSRKESKYDIWESGHSSTSISALAGIMMATNDDIRNLCIIGDASIINGVAFEGLNFIGMKKSKNPIIILNDNKMGISKTVGSVTKTFNNLRSKKIVIGSKKVFNTIFPKFITNQFHKFKNAFKAFVQQDNIFEDMGFDYYGPIDGHNIQALTKTFERIKKVNGPIIVHIITKKGYGYLPAQNDISGKYHGIEPFDIKTGEIISKDTRKSMSYIITQILIKLREKNDFYIITPAMSVGQKLEEFIKIYPSSFIDVGIAEEHAAVMAASMTLMNKKVVLLYYSTFAQRAYDYFLNDIARQNLPVIICLDRCGIVGEDGNTHNGIYDIAMFRSMPNFYILSASSTNEYSKVLNKALTFDHPVCIRYPKDKIDFKQEDIVLDDIEFKWHLISYNNPKVIVISYGLLCNKIKNIIVENSLDVIFVNAILIHPFDIKTFNKLEKLNLNYVVIEDVISEGSLANDISMRTINNVYEINFNKNISIYHASKEEIMNDFGFSNENIKEVILNAYKIR